MPGPGGQLPYCDLVMKGGITSGVVYPLAIAELSKKYQFKCIGGASAGAIAAAAAAAAEKGRNTGGFERLRGVSDDVAERLLSLFQPAPPMKPVFDAFVAAITPGPNGEKVPTSDKIAAALSTLLLGYAPTVFFGALPALVLAVVAARADAPLGYAIGVLPLLLLGVVVAVGIRLALVFTRDLPKNGFGICSGATESGGPEALTSWLHNMLNGLAGKDKGEPLTFGDLMGEDEKKPDIDLQVMTTSLGQGRPFRLPFSTDIFMWKKDEFLDLFGETIVRYMIEHGSPVDGRKDYYWFPRARNLPVVVAVRMSLSFPILLSAVPLHTRDYTLLNESEQEVPQPCWFSDGGICSNFPIHFFDSPWPSRPTFGISLEKHQPAHHGPVRVSLPESAGAGITRPLRPVTSIGGFIGAIIDTMQEWRDILQGCLPGYRERVVLVRLNEEEGGLNLAMPPRLVTKLGDYGSEAGALLRDQFSFDRHRWRRHLVWIAELENVLEKGKERYTTAPPNGETLAEFLERYAKAPDEYKQNPAWLADADQDLRELIGLAERWLSRTRLAEGKIPRPPVDLRITPEV